VRPYISEQQTRRPVETIHSVARVDEIPSASTPANTEDIEKRIRSAVIAKLGNQVDAKLLDNIIHRVVKGVGLK
jgi:hypothetical protein